MINFYVSANNFSNYIIATNQETTSICYAIHHKIKKNKTQVHSNIQYNTLLHNTTHTTREI